MRFILTVMLTFSLLLVYSKTPQQGLAKPGLPSNKSFYPRHDTASHYDAKDLDLAATPEQKNYTWYYIAGGLLATGGLGFAVGKRMK